MLIKVTQDHIDQGTRKSALSCPVALAVMEACKANLAQVTRYGIGVGYRRAVHAPASVSSFVLDFDKGHPVVPFEFELEVP